MTKHLSQSQIIPYLQGLTGHGIEVTILSFEERLADSQMEFTEANRLRQLLTDAKIKWKWLRYHKRPSLPATVYDVILGTVYAAYIVLRHRIDVVHSRGYVPLPIALFCKKVLGTKLVFDVRGLMAEEYVDAGHWKQGSLAFRITKWFERQAFRSADAVIVLTERIQHILRSTMPELQRSQAHVHVIPCCVDVENYPSKVDKLALRKELGIAKGPVMAYVGSLGTWYMGEEMVRLFKQLLHIQPSAIFLVLTQLPEIARELFQRNQVSPERFIIKTVTPAEVPRWLSAADFAVAFIKPCYSKISSSPTKVGEYLAAGLPFIINRGIGDLDDLLTNDSVGALVDSFDSDQYSSVVRGMLTMLQEGPALHQRCRAIAEEKFSMKNLGQVRYVNVYRGLETN